MADNILDISVRADFGQIGSEANEAAAAVSESAAQITSAMNSAGAAPEKLTYSMRSAREAIRGLGEETGVRLPRFVSSFLASIGPVGPAVAAAFPIIGAIGLIEVLGRAAEELEKFAQKAFRTGVAWEKIENSATSAIIGQERQIGELEEKIAELESGKLAALQIRYDLVGLSASQAGAQITSFLDATGKQLDDQISWWQSLNQWINAAADGAAAVGVKMTIPSMGAIAGSFGADLQKTLNTQGAQAGLDLVNQKLATLQKSLQTNPGDEQMKQYEKTLERIAALLGGEVMKEELEHKLILAEKGKAATDAADKEAKAEERAAKEAARALHEQIIAELDDLERAAKERTKLLEEEVRVNREANKEMDHEAEEAAKATQRAWEKAWEAVVRAQNKANEEQKKKLKEMQEQWNHMFAPINKAMDQIVEGMLKGTMTIGKAFADMGRAIVMDVVNSLLKALEAQIEYSITAGAIGKEHALGGIMRDAYKAASNVYAEVPFPFNLVAAPAMFATVVALGGGLPSAAGGWDVPSTGGFAMLHPNEMVLPANLAENVRGGGGGHTFNFNINAVDAPGVAAFFDEHAPKIARSLSRQMRKGNRF